MEWDCPDPYTPMIGQIKNRRKKRKKKEKKEKKLEPAEAPQNVKPQL